jgi:TIR domain
MTSPKLFISYSWTNTDHESWVLRRAEELRNNGIDVILDKWDLSEGHDAYAFMESMVSDESVTKVIMICDRAYTEKSNKKVGGAGVEAQIITPELYTKQKQDKFVAVVVERNENGEPYLPIYYKTRIYIDLSDQSNFATEFDRLLRWIWNKPLYIKPNIGKPPSFVTDENSTIRMSTSVSHRKAIDCVKNNRSNLISATKDYLNTVISELEKFKISFENNVLDDIFIKNIEDFLPYSNELIELFQAIASHQPSSETVETLHRFFENLIPFSDKCEQMNSWNECDFDNFRFIIHELFISCLGAFIKHEQFTYVAYFLENEYYYLNDRIQETMHSFTIFNPNIRILEIRNQRLNLRKISLQADLLEQRSKLNNLDFKYVMAADFILYFRSQNDDSSRCNKWNPRTLIYMENRYNGSFEMFSRAKSTRYFEKIAPLLVVKNKLELQEKLELIIEKGTVPNWGFRSLNLKTLLAFDLMMTNP